MTAINSVRGHIVSWTLFLGLVGFGLTIFAAAKLSELIGFRETF
ncbi:hypothetical protein [Sphingobium phenoxybenzoativorans]|nr:hypothetical protein [Sphingobium phenoxybenzoativorans]